MQAELCRVVVDDSAQVLALGGIECLNRLKNFDWQTLNVLNTFSISAIRLLRCIDSLLGESYLTPARLYLGMGFHDFTSNDIQ